MKRILALDPGSKKVGFIIMEGKVVIERGVILYKDIKSDLLSVLSFFHPDLCIVEKGGVPQAESMVKRILHNKGQKVVQYDSVIVREELGLFDVGVDNQNKKYVLKKHLGLKEYNNHIIDAALLLCYHYKVCKEDEKGE